MYFKDNKIYINKYIIEEKWYNNTYNETESLKHGLRF